LHSRDFGVVHLVADTELDCFILIKKLLSFLPQNNHSRTPVRQNDDDPDRKTTGLTEIVPVDPKKTYDMKRVVLEIIDVRKRTAMIQKSDVFLPWPNGLHRMLQWKLQPTRSNC
jgi:acetyl-CoA carboxylase carboxyltransferase component